MIKTEMVIADNGDKFNQQLNGSLADMQEDGHEIKEIQYKMAVEEECLWHSALIIYTTKEEEEEA